MNSTLLQIKDIWLTFWGQDVIYQLFFLIALLVIFRLEKNVWIKRVFFWYPLLVYVALMNPVTIKLGNYVWGSVVAYYCRQFSLIPIFFVIAYALIIGLSGIKDEMRKMGVVLLGLVVIMSSGKFIYNQEWVVEAENLLKVPNDVIYICDTISKEETDATVAVPWSLVNYIRQYDASMHLAYGRDSAHELAIQISSYYPDVDYIMQRCCMKGIGYVVVPKIDSVYDAFAIKGYMPWLEAQNYLVYECYGYDGIVNEYNDLEQICSSYLCDENGDIRTDSLGYSIEQYTYNESGLVHTVFYYDKSDQMVYLTPGYAGISYEYNEKGEKIKETYLDMAGNPVNTNWGYASIVYRRDKSGTVVDKQYYDVDGELCEEGNKSLSISQY